MAGGPTFVQMVSAQVSVTSGTTITASPVVATTAGNTLIAAFKFSSGTDISSITDTKGNAWRRDFNPNATQSNPPVWSCYLATALGPADTITVNLTASSANNDIFVYEYTNIAQSSWLDTAVTTTKTVTNVASITVGPSGPTSVDNELFVANMSSGSLLAWTPSAGWAHDYTTKPSHGDMADQAGGPAGSRVSVTWTTTASAGNITANILAYKPVVTRTDDLSTHDTGSSSDAATLTLIHHDFLSVFDQGTSSDGGSLISKPPSGPPRVNLPSGGYVLEPSTGIRDGIGRTTNAAVLEPPKSGVWVDESKTGGKPLGEE